MDSGVSKLLNKGMGLGSEKGMVINMGKREEQLMCSEELVKAFIQENRKQWSNIKHTEQYIFINFSMVRMQMAWIFPKLLYAKGVEMATKGMPIVFTWRENPLLTELIGSFGMKHIALDTLNYSHCDTFLKSFIKTAGFMLLDGSGEGIKKIEICGISAGRSLYEDIIRTSSLSTIKSARNIVCIKKMQHLLWTTYSLNLFCKKYRPCFVVCDDIAYHERMFLKLFHRYKAKIYNASHIGDGKISFEKDGRIKPRSLQKNIIIKQKVDQLDNEVIHWSEKYLKERYKGKNGRDIDRGAFVGKKVITRESIIKSLSLDPKKKNVVIMAHTFTDAVFNYGDLYFRDYYDWTEQTLKLAGEIESVNWILKPHPTRSAYNESVDSIEDMYERYKRPHIHWLSDDVSAESIRNIADVLVTIGGNAGAEFACEGIPSVIVGKPYYHGFGYTIEPKTRKEYEECLRKVDQIKRLNEEQIIKAKKVFYLANSNILSTAYTDEFAGLIIREYRNMLDEIALKYFASNDGTQQYNDKLMNQIVEYFQSHDMKECEYYRRGVLRGEECKE